MPRRGIRSLQRGARWAIALIVCALWAPFFMEVPADRLFPNYPVLEKGLILLLILGQAFLLALLSHRNRLMGERTALPAFFFLFILAGLGQFRFSLVSAATAFCMLGALACMLESYRYNRLAYILFPAGVCIGLAAWMVPPVLVFLLLIPTGLIFFRAFNWREWVFGLLGLLFAYYWAFALSYLLKGSVAPILSDFSLLLPDSPPFDPIPVDLMSYIWFALLWLLSIGGILFYAKGNAFWRRAYPFLLIFVLISIVACWLYRPLFPVMSNILAFPLALCFSFYFVHLKSDRFSILLLIVGFSLLVIRSLYYAAYVVG